MYGKCMLGFSSARAGPTRHELLRSAPTGSLNQSHRSDAATFADKRAMDLVCEGCFSDPKLREFIREHGEAGSCPWCGASGVATVPLVALGSAFREVARLYD